MTMKRVDFLNLRHKLELLNHDDMSVIVDNNDDEWVGQISIKMTAEAATAMKLSDKFLADRMYISHISDELKNKYRK